MKNIVSSRIRATLAVLLISGMAVGLSACNTVRGAGQDVTAVGHGVSNGATKTQQGIENATH